MANELDELAAKYSGAGAVEKKPDEWAQLAAVYSTPQAQVFDAAGENQKAMKAAPALSNMDKVKKGVIDPVEGSAQLLYNLLPKSIQQGGDRFNNWLADKTGLVAKVPKGGMNELVANNERAYQESRTANGESGIDGWRLAGNVISPANLVAASKATSLVAPASRVLGVTGANVLGGATGGVAQGLMAPVAEGDYWSEKGTQAGVSGAVGGALPLVAKLLPKNSAAATELKANGIDVPIGQSMDGLWGKVGRSIEDKATSIPLVGDAINANRMASIEQFNIATINKALAPIGEKLPLGVKAGREAIDTALEKNSNAYNQLLPKLKLQADNQFIGEMTQLKQMAQNMPDAELNQFNRILKNEIEDRFTSSGLMNGATMKEVESKLGQLARGYSRSEGYEKQQLGAALFQAQANLRGAVERSNPQYAQRLQDINKSYAALLRPERAASYVGAENGVFTPSQLLSAVKATDSSLRHRAFSRGNALMQDWAEVGKGTLSSKIPDSGTAGRLMVGGGALGGLGYLSPGAALGGAAATMAYLPGGRQVASGLLNLSEGTAKTIANRPAYAAPLLAPVVSGLLGN